MVKNSSANAGERRDAGLIPGSGGSPGGARGNSLLYSCLENPTDRGVWRVITMESQRVGHDRMIEHAHADSKMLVFISAGSFMYSFGRKSESGI